MSATSAGERLRRYFGFAPPDDARRRLRWVGCLAGVGFVAVLFALQGAGLSRLEGVGLTLAIEIVLFTAWRVIQRVVDQRSAARVTDRRPPPS